MRKLSAVFAALLVSVLAGTSCSKKEPPPAMPPKQGGMPGQSAAPQGMMGTGQEKTIVIPDDVKEAWKAVKVEVEFKEKKTSQQFTIPLNSEFKVPDTDLTLKTGSFLPNFSMAADRITSSSNEPENPACSIEVLEKGDQVFKGWLFSKFPDVHPFEHGRYGVKLLEGVKK